jgi:hypothetical protein
MPQLTPECDRVVLLGLQTSDLKDFDTMAFYRLGQMALEIRICEDYCLSDIYIVDLGKYSLGHITKITIPMIKKYELCAMVSTVNMRHENYNVNIRLVK